MDNSAFDNTPEQNTALQASSLSTPPSLPIPQNSLNDLGQFTRSKVCTPRQSINPLVAASATLLTLLTQLRQVESCPTLPTLQQELIYEIKAFESEAQCHSYHPDTLLAARYVLCVVLDECIENTSFGSQWEPYRLLTALNLDDWAGEGFFQLLDNISLSPARHIDLLTLMYLCLSLGFEGKHRHTKNGTKTLIAIRDDLYHLIAEQQGDCDKILSLSSPLPKKIITPTNTRQLTLPWWKIMSVCLGITGILFLGVNYLFEVTTRPALEILTQFSSSSPE